MRSQLDERICCTNFLSSKMDGDQRCCQLQRQSLPDLPAQDVSAPRGPAGPAARWYLLAGLLRCGICGRRLESAWSNHGPAYRCRHGYTSGTRPDSARPKNTYVREDQILPHLAALAILHADRGQAAARTGIAAVSAPGRTAELSQNR